MSDETAGEVTGLLRALEHGDRSALDRLIPLVYKELRKIAQAVMQDPGDHHTLQTTALIHEAYVRLLDQRSVTWADRRHFFAIASQTMRRILVDRARARLADKRGGEYGHLPLNDEITAGWTYPQCDRMLSIDEGLTKLARFAPRPSQIVQLRFFGGLSVTEIAEMLQVSTNTVMRDWRFARAWLAANL